MCSLSVSRLVYRALKDRGVWLPIIQYMSSVEIVEEDGQITIVKKRY